MATKTLKVISIRISDQQHQEIQALARAKGLSLSELSRKLYSEAITNEANVFHAA